MKKIEYRVRPVMRYQVTKYHQEDDGAGCQTLGVFDNEEMAEMVAEALAGQHGEDFQLIRRLSRAGNGWLLTERPPLGDKGEKA